MDSSEWTAHIRAAMVMYWLLQGVKLTTTEIATLTGLGYGGAYYLMTSLSGPLPIRQVGGKWQAISEDLGVA